MEAEISYALMVGFTIAVIAGIVMLVRHCKNTSYREED